ncbi:MAG: cation:proton antiporter [Candidatus Aminicenantes bacterium]|nr:cation:proton antiporter [Candidatus Aminicenantes bacterium]
MSEAEALLLLLVSLGAAVVPFISRRLHMPTAVLEIGYGLLLGAIAGAVPQDTVILDFLADLGFIILMYLAGLEINFEKLKDIPVRDILLGIFMYVIMITLSLWVALALGQEPLFSIVYFVTAVGLLFPVLREMQLLNRDLGQRYLVMGSIGELLSLGAFTVFAIYQSSGWSAASFLHMGEIFLFVTMAILVHRAVKLFTWWFPAATVMFTQKDDMAERGIRGSLVNLFIFVALASLLHLEPIIGAFIGGAVFALVFKQRQRVMEKIGGMAYGFFIPLFFIRVGLRFNPGELVDPAVLRLSGLIVLIMLGVRLAGLIPMLFSTMSVRALAGLPVATAFPLTLLVAVAAFGLESGILSRQESSAAVLTAMFTAVLFPLLLRLLLNPWRRREEAVKNLVINE